MDYKELRQLIMNTEAPPAEPGDTANGPTTSLALLKSQLTEEPTETFKLISKLEWKYSLLIGVYPGIAAYLQAKPSMRCYVVRHALKYMTEDELPEGKGPEIEACFYMHMRHTDTMTKLYIRNQLFAFWMGIPMVALLIGAICGSAKSAIVAMVWLIEWGVCHTLINSKEPAEKDDELGQAEDELRKTRMRLGLLVVRLWTLIIIFSAFDNADFSWASKELIPIGAAWRKWLEGALAILISIWGGGSLLWFIWYD